jgi:hypothetical protein
MCRQCGSYVHLGWKFYPKAGGDAFYALIVDHGTEVKVRSTYSTVILEGPFRFLLVVC